MKLMWTMSCGTVSTRWALHFVLSNISIWATSVQSFPISQFAKCEKIGPGLLICVLQRNKLSTVFQSVSSSVAAVLDMKCPSSHRELIIDVKSAVLKTSNTDFIVAEEILASSHSPYMNNAAPVHQHGNSTFIARSPMKRHVDTVSAPTTAVVKGKSGLGVMKTT